MHARWYHHLIRVLSLHDGAVADGLCSAVNLLGPTTAALGIAYVFLHQYVFHTFAQQVVFMPNLGHVRLL
jgi:hypothetical protein